jgi:hypothetical protein
MIPLKACGGFTDEDFCRRRNGSDWPAAHRYAPSFTFYVTDPSAPLYLGCARSARPLPRGLTGHVAHPIRSIRRREPAATQNVQRQSQQHASGAAYDERYST